MTSLNSGAPRDAYFRGIYHPIISDHIKQAPDKVASIKKLRGDEDGKLNKRYCDEMLFAFRLWHWACIGPVAVFVFFSFTLTAWLFFHWSLVGSPFDSEDIRYFVGANWVLNAAAMLGAVGSYFRVRNRNEILTANYSVAAKGSVGLPTVT
jgi:hypothetical protein